MPHLDPSITRILTVSGLGLAVGSLVSPVVIGFVDAVEWLNLWLLVSPYARVQNADHPWLLTVATILAPSLGGLVVGLMVHTLVAERRGLGPPDTILAVQTRRPPPTLKSGIASSLAALLSLGCGASVGQYGPLVYLGTQLGALTSRLRMGIRDLPAVGMACGVAAAIATAFNAPIAGLVFAHEVILRHYSLRAFAPVTVAAATGHVVANVIFARPPLFLVAFDGVRHSHEFLLFALEGVVCAGLAVVFMKLLISSSRLANRLALWPPLKPALAGLVLGLVALLVPEVLGVGKETLRFATIPGAFEMGELSLIIVAKILMTALCVGFGFVGGVFSPALLIGILFGTLYGLALPGLLPLPNSGIVVYAICGMMAISSTVIGAPLTTIIIVFELTRNYDLTIAAMVAVVFANLVAYRVFGRSLFDVQLAGRGFDLSFGRDKAILGNRPVMDFLRRDHTTVSPTDTVATLLNRLGDEGRAEALLVDGEGRYLGLIRLQDALGAHADAPVTGLARDGGVVFHESTTLWEAMEQIQDFVGEAVPLLAHDGRVLGVVPEGAVMAGYMETVHDLRREENAGT